MAETFYDYVIEKGFSQGKQIGLSQGEKLGLTKGEQLKARQVIRELDAEFPGITDQQLAKIVKMPLSFVQKVRAEIRKNKG